ncbi:hypothetical protein ACO0QE_003360 [Hanseniaspora vineae]
MGKNKNSAKPNGNSSSAAVTDVFGRDLSYLLACVDSPTFQVTSIDLESCEMESGYTPLHVCLKLGYLHKAFLLNEQWKNKIKNNFQVKDEKEELEKIWNFKDREHLNPLELYRVVNHLYVADSEITHLKHTDKFNQGAKTLYTFGSNTNMQLGTGDSNDRKTLCEIELDNNTKYKRVIMRKYYTLLETMNGDLYLCGNNGKNRMGFSNGNSIKNQSSFKRLNFNNKHKSSSIKDCALGGNHGMVLLENNDLLSWGYNEFSQLGYSTSESNSSEPRVVLSQPWKKNNAELKFISVSSIHSSIVDSQNYLYSWGLNVGQIGSSSSFSNYGSSFPFKDEILFKGLKGNIVRNPFAYKLPAWVGDVKQILAVDFATLILYGDNELCVLCNFKTFKFSIPKLGQQEISFDRFVPSKLSKPNKVVKIETKNKYGNNLCALYENGAVGIFSVKNDNQSTVFWNEQPYVLPFKYYWSPHVEWNKCINFSVASDGQIILCTNGGDVFYTPTMSRNTFRKNRSSKLTTGVCVDVACDPNFLSFAILKDDVDSFSPNEYTNPLWQNIAKISPLASFCDTEFQGKVRNTVVSQSVSQHNLSDEKENLGKHLQYDVHFYNEFGNLIGSCHKALLKARCRLLCQNLEKSGFHASTDGNIKFQLISSLDDFAVWKIKVILRNNDMIQYESLKFALHYIYTDTLITPFDDQIEQKSTETSTSFKLFIMQFMSALGITISNGNSGKLENCVKENFCKGEMNLIVENGEEVIPVSPIILAAGSSFFQNFLSYSWKFDGRNIEFPRLSKEEAMFTLKYLHGFSYDDLFANDGENERDLDDILNFYLSILDICNYFLLQDLKEWVENFLSQIVDSSTCISILYYAHTLDCQKLFRNCCWYLYNNIGLIFQEGSSNYIRENYSEKMWKALETEIRSFMENKRNKDCTHEKYQPWYATNETAFQLIRLFKSNVSKFDNVFMNNKELFEPSFSFEKSENLFSRNNNSAGFYKYRKPSFNSNHQRSNSSISLSQRPTLNVPSDIKSAGDVCGASQNDSVFDDDFNNSGYPFSSGQRSVSSSRRSSFVHVPITKSTEDFSDSDGFIDVERKKSKAKNKTISASAINDASSDLHKGFLRHGSVGEVLPRAVTNGNRAPTIEDPTMKNLHNVVINHNKNDRSDFTPDSLQAGTPVHGKTISATGLKKNILFPSFSDVLSTKAETLSKTNENHTRKNSADHYNIGGNGKIMTKKLTQKDRIRQSEHIKNITHDANIDNGSKKDDPWNLGTDIKTPKYANVDFPSLSEVYSGSTQKTVKSNKANKANSGTIISKAEVNKHNGNVTILSQHHSNQETVIQTSTPGMVSYFKNIGSFSKNNQKPQIKTKSIDECKQELEFEKWWQEESKKVQQQMKQQQEYEKKLMAVYGSELEIKAKTSETKDGQKLEPASSKKRHNKKPKNIKPKQQEKLLDETGQKNGSKEPRTSAKHRSKTNHKNKKSFNQTSSTKGKDILLKQEAPING